MRHMAIHMFQLQLVLRNNPLMSIHQDYQQYPEDRMDYFVAQCKSVNYDLAVQMHYEVCVVTYMNNTQRGLVVVMEIFHGILQMFDCLNDCHLAHPRLI